MITKGQTSARYLSRSDVGEHAQSLTGSAGLRKAQQKIVRINATCRIVIAPFHAYCWIYQHFFEHRHRAVGMRVLRG